MEIYIEGIELDVEEDAAFVKIEVTGAVTEANAINSVKAELSGKHFIVRRHTCKHEESEPCVSESLEEVGG